MFFSYNFYKHETIAAAENIAGIEEPVLKAAKGQTTAEGKKHHGTQITWSSN